MNFVGHAVVAAATDDDAAVLFGSMLPDFATMISARLGDIRHEAVARGVELHHATDDAFHGAPIFVELMGEARDELEAAGVSLGPSLAVGHVGVEQLEDPLLGLRPAEAPERNDRGAADIRLLVFEETDECRRLDPADLTRGGIKA